MLFQDRQDAGRKLAARLSQYKNQQVVVVALPRGGVPVGYEISKALHIPLTILSVRKIGAPSNAEYGIGAIAPHGVCYINNQIVQQMQISDSQLDKLIAIEKKELDRQQKIYGDSIPLEKKTVIVCDDGLATGVTAKAAIMFIKKEQAKKVILAVPVCPFEAIEEFEHLVDEFVFLQSKEDFIAVGGLYKNFYQVMDTEVIKLLKKAEKNLAKS